MKEDEARRKQQEEQERKKDEEDRKKEQKEEQEQESPLPTSPACPEDCHTDIEEALRFERELAEQTALDAVIPMEIPSPRTACEDAETATLAPDDLREAAESFMATIDYESQSILSIEIFCMNNHQHCMNVSRGLESIAASLAFPSSRAEGPGEADEGLLLGEINSCVNCCLLSHV